MKQVPSGGALRLTISSLRMACSIRLPPPPPYSAGQSNPTQRLSRTLRNHPA
jgi:hypothetical protein